MRTTWHQAAASGSLSPLTHWGRDKIDATSQTIFSSAFSWLIKISLKFVPKGPISNIPALVYIMAWRRPGAKPLSEPLMVSLLTHICVTRPQWVKYQSGFCPFQLILTEAKRLSLCKWQSQINFRDCKINNSCANFTDVGLAAQENWFMIDSFLINEDPVNWLINEINDVGHKYVRRENLS